jgi:hypothetical protein
VRFQKNSPGTERQLVRIVPDSYTFAGTAQALDAACLIYR